VNPASMSPISYSGGDYSRHQNVYTASLSTLPHMTSLHHHLVSTSLNFFASVADEETK
jgi:hypothetical protein